MEVAPALGCTEPVAIALGSAAAASLLPEKEIDSVEIWVDPNIYKNGLAVSIPGTGGLSGLDMAAALGALGGDPKQGLEVLNDINAEITKKAQAALRDGKVKVNLLADHQGLLIKTEIKGQGHVAKSVVQDMHDNIVSLTLDEKELEDSPLLSPSATGGPNPRAEMEAWLKQRSLQELLDLLEGLDDDDMAFLKESVTYNLRLAEYGLEHGSGLGIGKTLQKLAEQKLITNDMVLAARTLTSAAADARMSGVNLPAMSSAGSGNHGLTAVLTIWALKDYLDKTEQEILKAIGFSHLITAYVKTHTGRLSAVCGCSIAAGAGAAAGVAYLLGGNAQQIAGAIKNITEDLAGVICDGAKAGCALKLATASGNAVRSALFSLQGVNVMGTDGIIGATAEQTTHNLGTLSTQGMIETDRTILKIMLEKASILKEQ
jgi:L-cysteine desulfidase